MDVARRCHEGEDRAGLAGMRAEQRGKPLDAVRLPAERSLAKVAKRRAEARRRDEDNSGRGQRLPPDPSAGGGVQHHAAHEGEADRRH